jgi:hypothetical protein
LLLVIVAFLSGLLLLLEYLYMQYEEALCLAEDTTTPSERLQEAFNYYYKNDKGRFDGRTPQLHCIGRALARNPNTSPEALALLSGLPVSLAERFLPEIAQNPALPLLFLENWNLLPQEALERMTKIIFPSTEIVQILANHPDETIAQNARMHVHYSGEASENWHDEAGPLLAQLEHTPTERYFLNKFQQEALIRVPEWILTHLPEIDIPTPKPPKPRPIRPGTPESWDQERIATIKKAKQKERFVAVTESQNADFLRAMADDPNANVRGRVAGNPHTPPETLYQLAREEAMQRRLTSNASIPEDLLRSILEERPDLIEYIPYTRHAPLWALEMAWGGRSNGTVSRRLLRYPEANSQIQLSAFFFRHTSGLPRFIALFNFPELGSSCLDKMYCYRYSWWEKLAYVLNPNVPEKLIIPLITKDPNRFVRAAARERLGLAQLSNISQ